MSEPITYYIDDGFEPSNSGTSLVDISDETPEETALRILAEESWRRYQILRRRVTRTAQQSHFFELQPHGRGFRPATMGSTNRPAVPLPMGNSAPPGRSEASTLQPLPDGAVGGTAVEAPHVIPEADAAAQGHIAAVAALANAPGGAGPTGNRTNRNSPNFFNDQHRTENVLRVIDEGPRGGNQSADADQANRSIRDTLRRTVAQTGQVVGDAFRHCANASPFRQPGASTRRSPVNAGSQGTVGADLAAAVRPDLVGDAGPAGSVHLSRAQIEIHPSASGRTARNDPRGAFIRPPASQHQAAIAQNPATREQAGANANTAPEVVLPVNDQQAIGEVIAPPAYLLPISRN